LEAGSCKTKTTLPVMRAGGEEERDGAARWCLARASSMRRAGRTNVHGGQRNLSFAATMNTFKNSLIYWLLSKCPGNILINK